MIRSLLSVLFFAVSCTGVAGGETSSPNAEKTRLKAKTAYSFCRERRYSTQYCILVDMDLPSGRNRMFVWDFKRDTIVYSCLVTHGCGPDRGGAGRRPAFSNEPDSHCSSRGKYRIGKRDYSGWGIHVKYVLHGLETSNSNAERRVVVLHSWERIPDHEVFPAAISESWGCPAVSDHSMRYLDGLLKQQCMPVLLWIYN